jgi:hypothetical protein
MRQIEQAFVIMCLDITEDFENPQYDGQLASLLLEEPISLCTKKYQPFELSRTPRGGRI